MTDLAECLYTDGTHPRPLPEHDLCSRCERSREEARRDASTADRPAGFVIKVPGQGYFVKSRTTSGVWWHVLGRDCSCPAEHSPCWHVKRCYEFEAAMTTPRPSAPPHISALVD